MKSKLSIINQFAYINNINACNNKVLNYLKIFIKNIFDLWLYNNIIFKYIMSIYPHLQGIYTSI